MTLHARAAGSGLDEHMEQSRLAQRQADKWLISGSFLIGTAALGIFGLPLFLRGVWLLRKAQRDGLSVRPMLVTLLGLSGHHRRGHQYLRAGHSTSSPATPFSPECC